MYVVDPQLIFIDDWVGFSHWTNGPLIRSFVHFRLVSNLFLLVFISISSDALSLYDP
jgi:hypothetical protein